MTLTAAKEILSAKAAEESFIESSPEIKELGEYVFEGDTVPCSENDPSYHKYVDRLMNGLTEGSELYVSDDALADYADELGYITADHILVMTVDPESREPLDEATVAEKRALADELLARLRASDDPIALFRALADEYSEDTGRAANPDGYTFAEGTMVEEFDDAARALGENEISDVVESVYGCHIILRKPLDRAAAADAVRDAYADHSFLDAANAADMTVTDAARDFDVAAVYEAIIAAHAAVPEDAAQENPFAP
jgi:hypothetical protein